MCKRSKDRFECYIFVSFVIAQLVVALHHGPPLLIATAAPCARAAAKGGKKMDSPMPKVPNRVRRATLAVSKAYG